MIYAALEHKIREELKTQFAYFPDLKYKSTQTPTARWVFFYFQGLHLLTITQDKELVANLKQRNSIIIDCLGQGIKKFILENTRLYS
jgi:hypothetical protein